MIPTSQTDTALSLEGRAEEESILYTCQGTCSKAIEVTAKDGIIENVTFFGGCNGNTKGLSQLVRGMKVEDVIAKLKGTQCGNRGTSCPDQLSHALEQLKTNSHA